MGRREAPLRDDDDSCVRFAADLRALRIASGEPTYRQMASRCHFSAATLARASSGRVMPSLEVTLAFVAACGGDPGPWRHRWEQARREHPVVDGRPETGGDIGKPLPPDEGEQAPTSEKDAQPTPEPAAQTRLPALTPRRRLNRGALLSGALALSLTLNAVLLLSADKQREPSPSADTATSEPIHDGTDPEANHCSDDATDLDVQQVRLRSSALIDSRLLHAGTPIGTITLRYSHRCAGAWARFDPAKGLFLDPNQASITLEVGRPADGSQNSWRLGHIDQTYSDLLLTGMGCVRASATVTIFNGDITADGTTQCLPPMA